MYEPGDIILRRRPQYKGVFRYFITRCILFFTTAWWKKESTSKHYHAEMVYGGGSSPISPTETEWLSITMEPPKCRIRSMPRTRILVLRSRVKPDDFDQKFQDYCQQKLGQRYDYMRFLWLGVYWLFFGWNWLGLLYKNPYRDVCSEFVARFYEELGRPISDVPADLTTPDDIYDFYQKHPLFFQVIMDC